MITPLSHDTDFQHSCRALPTQHAANALLLQPERKLRYPPDADTSHPLRGIRCQTAPGDGGKRLGRLWCWRRQRQAMQRARGQLLVIAVLRQTAQTLPLWPVSTGRARRRVGIVAIRPRGDRVGTHVPTPGGIGSSHGRRLRRLGSRSTTEQMSTGYSGTEYPSVMAA
jgi:hypothetical protein